MKHLVLCLAASISIVFTSHVATAATPPRALVEVDEAAELTAAVMRVAGYDEYTLNDCKAYVTALDSLLEPVKEHPAVELAHKIRKSGIGYDAVASLALALEIQNDSVRFNPTLDAAKMLDDRWYFPTAERMVALLDDFYRTSGFHHFFESQKPFYAKAIANMETMLTSVDFKWLEDFYGVPFDKVRVALSFSNDGNYGMTLKGIDGQDVFSPWICAYNTDDEGVPTYHGHEGIIIHEGTHPITNPLVDLYLDKFNGNSARTVQLREKQLARMAYASANTVIYETMVRACHKRYDLAHAATGADSTAVIDNLRRETANFLTEEAIFNALGDYQHNRDKYPTIADFIPRLVDVHNSTSPDSVYNALLIRGPRIIGFNIEDGAILNAGEHVLSITFDKPVVYGFGLGKIDGLEVPDTSGGPHRSEDRCSFSIGLILEPGKQYGISFPGWFGSVDHYYVPETVELRFSTLP